MKIITGTENEYREIDLVTVAENNISKIKKNILRA